MIKKLLTFYSIFLVRRIFIFIFRFLFLLFVEFFFFVQTTFVYLNYGFPIEFFLDILELVHFGRRPVEFSHFLFGDTGNEVFNLVNSETIFPKHSLLNWTTFRKVGVNRQLNSKSVGVLGFHLEVLV